MITTKIISQIRKYKDSSNWNLRFIYTFCLKIWLFYRFFSQPKYRAEKITLFTKKTKIHQTSTYTEINRYPALFEIAQKYFRDQQPKILSFGCSTGEEVLSIQKLFPSSEIIGVDINRWCLKQCKKKINENNTRFYERFDKEFEADSDYDLIFCLAVFQQSANRNNIDNEISVYPFSQFENEILFLDKKLKTGGLFFLDKADFSFTDTSCFCKYTPHPSENNRIINERPQYNIHNHKIADEQNNYRVFIKKFN